MATHIGPGPDERLAELEALDRLLTDEESEELRRCIHTLYMRHWRAELAEREMNLPAVTEHKVTPPAINKAHVEAIADRMIAARNEAWLPRKFDRWQDDARQGSQMLLAAIQKATVAA